MVKLPKKYRVIILDFVNTLVNFDSNWDPLREINAQIFKNFGVEVNPQHLRPIIEQTANQLNYLKKLNFSDKTLAQIRKELIAAQHKFEQDSIKSISVFADVKVFIKYAIDNDLRTAVLTSNISKTVKKVFSENMIEFTGFIIGREHVNYPKPSPEGILKLLNKLKVKSKSCVLIGDSDFDIDAAKSVGCLAIFIKRNAKTKLSYTKADFVINSFDELTFSD